MAKPVVSEGNSVDFDFPLHVFLEGFDVASNARRFEIGNEVGFLELKGTGFTYTNDDILKSGTIHDFAFKDSDDAPIMSLTGFTVKVKNFSAIAATETTADDKKFFADMFSDADKLTGGNLRDVLLGYGGNDTINGLGGSDTLDGGNGNDRINGGIGADTLIGGSGTDTIAGLDGIDTINGGVGNDRLNGGLGTDLLTGGKGADRFIVSAASDISWNEGGDTITDFSRAQKDKVDLSNIAHFKWIGEAEFDGNGPQLRMNEFQGDTYVLGNIDGDEGGTAEIQLIFLGSVDLKASDFIL